MARKTISIPEKAYNRLRARKRPDESFSDVILRLVASEPLAESAGMLSKPTVRAIRTATDEARRDRRTMDRRRERMPDESPTRLEEIGGTVKLRRQLGDRLRDMEEGSDDL